MNTEIPDTQTAVQLTGPDNLILNTQKPVHRPGPHQILCRVEAVGLCFSDLKLLHQFSDHVRKSKIIAGIESDVLEEIPTYVPGDLPAVPGHEATVRICAVGDSVKNITLGGRYLVQTDYRWLLTENSNAAFGYNFEGALQQYVLMDQRVITSPDGKSMLIPASENLSASAIALVEPWACVEDAYAVNERTTLTNDSRMLLVADTDIDENLFTAFLADFGKPARITRISKSSSISQLDDTAYDDVIYFGANPETVEALFTKIAPKGLLNIVLCGQRFSAPVVTTVGRIHYGNIRIIGTTTSDPADSMRYIPPTAEIRTGDKINVVGAAGPMGVMHVVRNICQGVENITVFGGDLDYDRLAVLTNIAEPLAKENNVTFIPYNPAKENLATTFNYTVLMAPIPKLVADAVASSAPGGIINIFAGIPATVTHPVDLDAYIENKLYFIGTSGSTLADMETVLAKVENNLLDTNISVAAVCGFQGALDGIDAVKNHTIPGKIIVYPACEDLPLTTLDDLNRQLPAVAEKLSKSLWTTQAEEMLLKQS